MIYNYEEAVAYIMDVPRFSKKNGFEISKAFLDRLGDVSKTVNTIHVAGTNGKGSVCALLRAGLYEPGKRIGMFISPHLVDIRERFLINDEMISKEDFLRSFDTVMTCLDIFRKETGKEDYHPSFFEMLFFMASVYYKEKKVDVLILETGLGGRLDATNTIAAPILTIITEIGLDHTEYLGDTKELIAGEKAGIIKRRVPIVFMNKKEGYERVIRDKALEMEAPIYELSYEDIKNLKVGEEGIDFLYQSRYDDSEFLCLRTGALYQAENGSLAFLALSVLRDRLKLDMKEIPKRLKDFHWEGRFERVEPNLVLDGGHNEDGIRAFLQSVMEDGALKRSLLYSAVSDKEIEKIGGLIKEAGLFQKIYVCKMEGYRAASMERLREAFSGAEADILSFDSLQEGFYEMRKAAKAGEMQYVAGSLYLIGAVKELL